MKHLMRYGAVPTAFVAAFLLFGIPSAPGIVAVGTVTEVSVDVGGCAHAYGMGDDEDDFPDVGRPNFDDFMCATSAVAGLWAVRSAYVGGALVLMGGVPSAASFFAAGAIGAYAMVTGLMFCGK